MASGIALNAAAQEWPTLTPSSQTPPASTVTAPQPSETTAQAQATPSQSQTQPGTDSSDNNNPQPQPAAPVVQQPQPTAPPRPAANKSGSQNQQPPNNNLETRDWKLRKISPDYDWTRHFRIGMLAGFNIKADFTMSGTFGIGSSTPGVYDDGYVLTDSTGNAGGLTGYWGYQNASQISGNSLLMHQATGFSVVNGTSSHDDAPYLGFDLAYGDSYWYWEHAKLGWEFGFGFLPIHVVGNASVRVNRNIDNYDITGVLMPPPGYQGGFDASGETSLIGGSPTSSSTDTIAGTTSEKLDVQLYTIRLGPTLYWNLCRKVGLYVGGGPAVGMVSGDLSSSGIIQLADGSTAHYNATHSSGLSMVYGGYVNATLVYHAVEGGDFYLGAQYMPMNGSTISGNGASGHLDLSGQAYITAGINWPF